MFDLQGKNKGSTLSGILHAKRANRATNGGLCCAGFILALVWIAGPEKSTQTILATSRNDVDVKMRHALADTIVHRYKCSVSFHCQLDRACQMLRVREKTAN